MLDDLKEMLKEVVADDELFELLARGMRKSFNALVAQGFTEEQAMRIVVEQGMSVTKTK